MRYQTESQTDSESFPSSAFADSSESYLIRIWGGLLPKHRFVGWESQHGTAIARITPFKACFSMNSEPIELKIEAREEPISAHIVLKDEHNRFIIDGALAVGRAYFRKSARAADADPNCERLKA